MTHSIYSTRMAPRPLMALLPSDYPSIHDRLSPQLNLFYSVRSGVAVYAPSLPQGLSLRGMDGEKLHPPQMSSTRPSSPTIIQRIHFLIRSSGDESEPVRGAYSRHNPTHPAAGQIWRAKFNYSLAHQRSVPYTPQLYEIMISFIFPCCMERAQTPEKMPPAPAPIAQSEEWRFALYDGTHVVHFPAANANANAD